MAMDTGSQRGGLNSQINVTPLVDVMLVLLIIMMLIAPILRAGVPLKLPEANNTAEKPDTQAQTVVAIDSDSRFYVNLMPVTADGLVPAVQRALDDTKEKLVYLKGDKNASYSAIMGAMDALRKAEIENIALITEPKPDQSGKPAAEGR